MPESEIIAPEAAAAQGLPPRGRRAAAEARGYELTSIARKVTPEDLSPDQFDIVLAMDAENHAILTQMAGGIAPHIRLFSDYLDDEWPNDVPDHTMVRRMGSVRYWISWKRDAH